MAIQPETKCDTFVRDEDGAVTVDWVVLSASVVGMAMVVWNIVVAGIYEGSSFIESGVENAIDGNY